MSGPARAAAAPARIRDAAAGDLPAIREIYAHYVVHGLASFEEVAPDLEEMTRRYESTRTAGYPYIAAEIEGRLAGYAHGGPYRPRPAYRFTVENTVYVAPAALRRGVGRSLLAALIERCTERGFRRMIAVVGDSANESSIGLHQALGFRIVGVLPSVGFKLGRWVDSVMLERPLGPGDSSPPPLP